MVAYVGSAFLGHDIRDVAVVGYDLRRMQWTVPLASILKWT
jgi:hypothetical protein